MKNLIIFLSLIFVVNLSATIINIPADQLTIQEGINVAVAGDTVLVQPGTYIENINFNGKSIVIGSLFLTTQANYYISQTIVDGNNNGSVVTFSSGEDSTSVLIGFTIQHGFNSVQPYVAGGIHCDNSSPILSNLIITNNYAKRGGGIWCKSNSNPQISNVSISNNSAPIGGGIYCKSGSNPIINNVVLDNNYGSGLTCFFECSPIVNDVTITNNSNGFSGGGINCYSSNPSLTNIIISNNSSVTYGGGVFCDDESTPNMTNLTISNNTSELGGGIYCENDSEPNIINTLIVNNNASYGGGLYCCTSSSLKLINSTIVNNSAISGSGIYCSTDAHPQVINSILRNNYPEEIHLGSGACNVIASFSNIQGGWEGTGNIDNDPLFTGSGNYPFSLQAISPCVDLGIPDTTGLNLPAFDLAGNPRIYGGRIDMGAYEYRTSSPTGFIAGTVTNLNGDPLEFAEITAEGFVTICNNNGEYFMEVEAGDYNIFCNSEGYEISDYYEISVLNGETVSIDFVLEPAVSVDNPIINKVDNQLSNYPNPFNPSTTISFSIRENSKIILSIYNIKGQKIKTLIDDEIGKGNHSIIWNGVDEAGKPIGSGLYFYKLNVNGKTESVKKCLLVK